MNKVIMKIMGVLSITLAINAALFGLAVGVYYLIYLGLPADDWMVTLKEYFTVAWLAMFAGVFLGKL